MGLELTKEEYIQTMNGKMTDVSSTAEPVVDIWPYVAELVGRGKVSEYVYDNQLVESVYRNEIETYDHVLLPTSDKNTFVVIIVNLHQREIAGHFHLDLNNEYGLTDT